MATKYSFSTPSSGFISGLPYAASKADSLDGVSILSAAVEQILTDGNKSLKDQLEASDLWAPYASMVKIVWDEKAGQLSYVLLGDAAQNDAMRDLEYGTPDVPPTGMLRKHATRLGDTTSVAASSKVREVIGLG